MNTAVVPSCAGSSARPRAGTSSHACPHATSLTPPALPSRRAALLSAMIAVTSTSLTMPALATGLESMDMPTFKLPEAAEKALVERAAAQQQRLAEAEAKFQSSDLLSSLKQRSEENKAKNKKELEEKYCFRQAELGVGDCGGLRFVPEYRDQFVPKRPGWLDALVGGGGSSTGSSE